MNGLAKWLPFIFSVFVVVVGVTATFYTLKADVDTARVVQKKTNDDNEKEHKEFREALKNINTAIKKIEKKQTIDSLTTIQLLEQNAKIIDQLEEINEKLE